MIFHLYADCTFEGEDLEDAFNKLSRHFANLNREDQKDEDDLQMRTGEINLGPLPPTLGVSVQDAATPRDRFGKL